MDIKSAFLQDMELSREIYIRLQPEAVGNNVLFHNTCSLSHYGMQAPISPIKHLSHYAKLIGW